MAITASDFANWKSDPVTKAFFEAANERVQEARDILETSAGIDPNSDNLLRGLCRAYREIQEFRIDDLEGAE